MDMKNNVKKIVLCLLIAIIAFLPFVDQKASLFVTASEELTDAELNKSESLHEKLHAILSDERLDGTVTGVSVRKADTGEELFSGRRHPIASCFQYEAVDKHCRIRNTW